jgi:RNA polymerase sigma-70 factor (sigma-E family)
MVGVAEGVGVIFKPAASRIERLGEWYVARYEPLLRFAFFVCRDREHAEDLVQESFVRLYRAGRHAEEEGLEAYAKRTITNLSRSRWRRLTHERGARPLLLNHPSHDATASVDVRDAVWEAVGSLSPQQRACVALRFYEDMEESRIAATLGVSAGTVKTQLHRAMQKLRATLGESEER